MTHKCLLVFLVTIVAVNSASVHLKLFKNPSRAHERFILKLVSAREGSKEAANKAKFVENSLEKVEKIREVINVGIRDLKTDADNYSTKHGVKKVDESRWKTLSESIDKRVNYLRRTILTKDSSDTNNIWELFLVDFEITFGAFVQNVTEDLQTGSEGNKENEKPVLVLFIQAGVGSLLQEIQETINPPYEEIDTEPDVPVQMPKTVLTLISSFIQGQTGATQNDAPVSQRPIQALAESIGQAVSNLNPFRTTTTSPPSSTTQSASSSSVAEDVSTQSSNLDQKQENVKIDNLANNNNNQSAAPLNVVIHVVYDKSSLDALTTQPQSAQATSNTVVEPKLPERSGVSAPQEKPAQQLPVISGSSSSKTSVAELENKHVSQGDTFNIIIDLSSVTSNLAQNNVNSVKKDTEDKKGETLKDGDKNVVLTTEAVEPSSSSPAPLSSSQSSISSSPSPSPSSFVSTTEAFISSSAEELVSSTNIKDANIDEVKQPSFIDQRINPSTITIKYEESTTEEVRSSSSSVDSSISESSEENKSTTVEQIETTSPPINEPSLDIKSDLQEETNSVDQNQPQELQEENSQSTTAEVVTSTEQAVRGSLEDVSIPDETYNCRFAHVDRKEQVKREGNRDKNAVKKLKKKGTSR